MKDKIKKVEDLFSNLSEVTPENLDLIVSESIKTFESIMVKLNSSDEQEKKEAIEAASLLRATLEKQAEKAFAAINMNVAELDTFISNPSNFSEEEWNALEKAKHDLGAYQKDIKERGYVADTTPAKPKAKKVKSTAWVRS